MLCIYNHTPIYYIICIIIILCIIYSVLCIVYIVYLIIMCYIDMLSIILHDTSTNVCDIDRNSCILLFNLYMQCRYIAFLY